MSLAGFHLHLYQPPRESPWLGTVEREWSAWPYHDWNERIAAECYRALVAVALSAPDGEIELVEPLAASSLDVGPTLRHWFDRFARDVEGAITREAASRGPASRTALVAPYVHAILPLAHPEDARRLIAWGVADYRVRHGVDPAGAWLPETAVDLATLSLLADAGVAYTVLMPGQAARVRVGDGPWRAVTAETLDTSRAYEVRLGDGRSVTVVFGNRELSQGVAFGGLVADGQALGAAMRAAAGEDGAALVVADAETYGHHHRFGELGLAWAQRELAAAGVETSLGEWLEGQTPSAEVELLAVSSWSCAHGVERWRSACGDVTGEQPGFDLNWRAPLRAALDWLRAAIVDAIEPELALLVRSSDEALTAYGEVLARAATPEGFVAAHRSRPLDDAEVTAVLELCEAYRHLLYGFTSCAWFFADPGEIETSIALRFAARAIELCASATGVDLAASFAAALADVRSALHGVAGAALLERAVAAGRVTPAQVAAGAAVEWATRPTDARSRRGDWAVSAKPSGDAWRVEVEDSRTLRRWGFSASVDATDPRAPTVVVAGDDGESSYSLADLGSDVVARVATAWLADPTSRNFEAALNSFATELLTRGATRGDEAILRALAGAPRCVSPDGEAAVRRALQAVAVHGDGDDHAPLAALARAVGLGALYPVNGHELGHL